MSAFVAGNWKMNGDSSSCVALARDIARAGAPRCALAVFPPAPYLAAVGRELAGSSVDLGGQDVHWEASGAFTGEIGAGMLRDLGCRWALVGHSERRHVMGESDGIIRRKLEGALRGGLDVVLCIGETEAEREDDLTEAVLERQISSALAGIEARPGQVVLAYEPVWAIGTGRTATTSIIQEAHQAALGLARRHAPAVFVETQGLLYGGSVKSGNAAEISSVPGVTGLLGGASLDAASFLAIAAASSST